MKRLLNENADNNLRVHTLLQATFAQVLILFNPAHSWLRGHAPLLLPLLQQPRFCKGSQNNLKRLPPAVAKLVPAPGSRRASCPLAGAGSAGSAAAWGRVAAAAAAAAESPPRLERDENAAEDGRRRLGARRWMISSSSSVDRVDADPADPAPPPVIPVTVLGGDTPDADDARAAAAEGHGIN
jgi:hypothetical protein